jgi:hypothetical protein
VKETFTFPLIPDTVETVIVAVLLKFKPVDSIVDPVFVDMAY